MRFIALGFGLAVIAATITRADACTIGGCPDWPSTCYNLKKTKWCPNASGVSAVSMTNYGSYESAFDWARAEISNPKNGIANSITLSQVASGGKIKVYDYTGSADWWGLADQYVTTDGTCMKSARIQVNKGYMTSTVRKQYTILHEIGHTVGLDHVCVCDRTMNPCGTCGDDAAGATPYLKTCDAQGIAKKYPGNDLTTAPPEDEAVIHQAHLLDAAAHSDVDGDGLADACIRQAAGVRCHLATGAGFSAALTGPELSDASGWSDSDNASTLRLLDLDGDGRADLCARANAGIRCWKSTGSGFSAAINGPEWSDASGWDDPMYFTTIRAADIDGDGKDDLCARSFAGFACHPSTGDGFGAAVTGPALSNAAGWNAPDRYATIQLGDIDGNGTADVCGRDAAGMRCWLSDGASFTTEIAGPDWSDAAGFKDPMYFSTIRLADVDGDGKADLCARTSTDFRCYLSTGSSFEPGVIGPAWSTASGWGQEDNYATIRLGDLDADGDLDLCARANAGIVCSRWEPTGFGDTFGGPELSDAKGWNNPEYFRTLRLADVTGDGAADLCARAGAGLVCWPSTASGFGAQIDGPAWSDASGYDDVKYYPGLRLAGALPKPPPSGSDAGVSGAAGASGAGGSGWAGTSSGNGSGGSDPGEPAGAQSDSAGSCSAARGGRASGEVWLAFLLAIAMLARGRLGAACADSRRSS